MDNDYMFTCCRNVQKINGIYCIKMPNLPNSRDTLNRPTHVFGGGGRKWKWGWKILNLPVIVKTLSWNFKT